jgi:hypothetical protein
MGIMFLILVVVMLLIDGMGLWCQIVYMLIGLVWVIVSRIRMRWVWIERWIRDHSM